MQYRRFGKTEMSLSAFTLGLMRDFEASMKAIGMDVLDNLDLHGINNEAALRRAVDEKETWRAVRNLADAGTIRHVGFSTHGKPDVLRRILDTEMFESINLRYGTRNPLKRQAGNRLRS
jgi:uncharacterized protein